MIAHPINTAAVLSVRVTVITVVVGLATLVVKILDIKLPRTAIDVAWFLENSDVYQKRGAIMRHAVLKLSFRLSKMAARTSAKTIVEKIQRCAVPRLVVRESTAFVSSPRIG